MVSAGLADKGRVGIWEAMKFATDTTCSFKRSGIGKPGKIMTESMAWKKPKDLGREEDQQPVELIVKSKKKLRVNWNV